MAFCALYATANLLAPRTTGSSAAPISFLPNWLSIALTSEFSSDGRLRVTVLADDRMVACRDAVHAASETPVEEYLSPLLRHRQQLEAVLGKVAEVLESDRYAGASLDDYPLTAASAMGCRALSKATWPAFATGVVPAALQTRLIP
jgi:hypothetical protein